MWYLDIIYIICRIYNCNRIGDVMVDRVKSKTMKLVFVVSPLSTRKSMKILKGKMTMFLSNLSYAGHLDERWRDLKRYIINLA
jgi:hypothetical protein